MQIVLNPMDKQYHDWRKFREQIAVLQIAGIDERTETIHLFRSYVGVGLPGQVGFDTDRPGYDTSVGWENIDKRIEEDGVRGVFHTHPQGFHDFSEKDWTTMYAFALTYGDRHLWYGVQSADHDVAHFVCLRMIGSNVFCFDCGWVKSDPGSHLVSLPVPIKIDSQSMMPNANIYMIHL
jgi:hypothetical protein